MMAVVFPFEETFYKKYDVPVRFVGHPLVDEVHTSTDKATLLNEFVLDDDKPIVGRLRVATKFVNTAKQFYADKGIQVEVIKLYGSMELAPLVGLADRIVDVVDTGNTLKANGLTPLEHIADISSRLVVNKASMKMKHHRVKQLIDRISEAVNS